MNMRAPKAEATGTAGQSIVKGKFERLEWGPNPNLDHDLGTDLWLQARDKRRYDLQTLVGAQIKSTADGDGHGYFDRPEKGEDGRTIGWWYRESAQDHFRYWFGHVVPHLLILHDHRTDSAYWVHVTEESVELTGQGAKILVPKDQTVDEDHRVALENVAKTSKVAPAWEGSAWSTHNKIHHTDRLRHALIAPRLVAPHPNNMPTAIDPAQAIALTTSLRIRDLKGREGRNYPEPEECRDSTEWGWRAFAAVHDAVTNGAAVDALPSLVDSADEPFEAAAIACVYVSFLHELGQCHRGHDLLTSLIDADELGPADDAWLRLQRARIMADTGKQVEARREALDVIQTTSGRTDDPTVAAIQGSASSLVLATSRLSDLDLAATISHGDNAVLWWRSQTTSWGLATNFNETFKNWAKDRSVTIGREDSAWLHLRSSTLTSGFLGDQSAWQRTMSMLARLQLVGMTDDADVVIDSIDMLRKAGDNKSLKMATARALLLGPASAIRDLAADVDLDLSTSTSIQSDLVLLTQGGDVLDQITADRAASWALAAMRDVDGFVAKYSPTFLVRNTVPEMLAAVVPACSAAAIRDVIDQLTGLPVLDDQLAAQAWGKVLARVDRTAFTPEDLAALRNRGSEDNWEFTDDIQTLLARRDPDYRTRLRDDIATGSVEALRIYGDLGDLPPEVAAGMIQALVGEVADQTASAREGRGYSIGQYEPLGVLALLNLWFPDVAEWNPVVDRLNVKVFPHQVVGALEQVAAHAEKVPEDQIEPLVHVLKDLTATADVDALSFPTERVDPRGPAADALNALRPGEVNARQIANLLEGDHETRESAALIIGRRHMAEDLLLLVAVARDPEPRVRATVAQVLTDWVVRDVGGATVLEELLALVRRDRGTHLAQSVAYILSLHPDDPRLASVCDELTGHPSARVRRYLQHRTDNLEPATSGL